MKFKLLQNSYIHNTYYNKGTVIDIDVDDLAKDENGNIDLSKHSALDPVDALKTIPDPVEVDDEPADTDDPQLTDEEKKQGIKDALEILDASVDGHWTQAGLPSVEAVEEFLGVDVTRKEISELAPKFTRPQS